MDILEEKLKKVIPRQLYLKDIDSILDSNLINVIVWPRRVGKSYFLYSVINYLLEKDIITSNQIFYINKEWIEFDFIQDYRDLQNYFSKFRIDTSKKFFVWLDEVQEIKWWEKFVLSLQSKYSNAIIFVTGSNSKLLASKFATLLAGRYIQKVIYPLSFKEFKYFSGISNEQKAFELYVKIWWLPKVSFLQDEDLIFEYLQWVYNTVFVKDIVEFFKIRNVSILRKIHKFLFSQMGSVISASNISNYFKSQKIKVSVDTVVDYINYSKDAFLFNEIERYDIRWKKILEVHSKIYSFDLGIRNAVVWWNFKKDIEKYLEQIVLNHLLIWWWKAYVGILRDKEIDFIAEKGWKKIYIQVCYLLSSEKVVEREFWNLLKIKDNWPKYVISMDPIKYWNYEWISHLNIFEFLNNFESVLEI